MKLWRSLVVAAGLMPALAGCAAVSCRAVGCVSTVSVDLSRVGRQFGTAPATATLCVNGDCQTDPVEFIGSNITAIINHDLPTVTASPVDSAVTVTLKLERDGKVLVDAHTDTTLTKVAPNGERCGPICYSSALALVGTQLDQVPTATSTP